MCLLFRIHLIYVKTKQKTYIHILYICYNFGMRLRSLPHLQKPLGFSAKMTKNHLITKLGHAKHWHLKEHVSGQKYVNMNNIAAISLFAALNKINL